MTTTKERIEGHYEVREFLYGKVHTWAPGHAYIECDCGQLTIAGEATVACPRCGAVYTDVVGEPAGKPPEREEICCFEHGEYQEWPKNKEVRLEYRECLFSGLFSGLKAKDEINRLLDELCNA